MRFAQFIFQKAFQILSFFVYSNLLIASVACAVTYSVASSVQLQHAFFYGVVAFGATLFSYNLQRFNRHTDFKNNPSIRHSWLVKHIYVLKGFIVVGFMMATVVYFWKCFNWKSFPILVVLFGVSVLYAFKNNKLGISPLRNVPFVKIHLIALTWVVVLFIWPVLDSSKMTISSWVIAVALYFFFIAITIPFDIRDFDFDNAQQQTIPQVFGVNKAKVVALVFLVLAAFLLFYELPVIFANPSFLILFIGHFLLITFSSKRRPDWYYSLGIDGWIIWLAFLLS